MVFGMKLKISILAKQDIIGKGTSRGGKWKFSSVEPSSEELRGRKRNSIEIMVQDYYTSFRSHRSGTNKHAMNNSWYGMLANLAE